MSPQDAVKQPLNTSSNSSSHCYLVTGVLRPSSVATAVAREALAQGARVILTAPAATAALTAAQARRLGVTAPVLQWDATDPASGAKLANDLAALGVKRLDGVLHAVAHADSGLLGTLLPKGLDTDLVQRSNSLERAFTVSVTSLSSLTAALKPLLHPGASLLSLSFDTSHVHPGYGWMGPLKAALEAVVRGLAVELGPDGVQVNALSLGPLQSPAAQAIPGFSQLAEAWSERAAIGWDPAQPEAAARTALMLLAGALPATTGQVLRCDGGAALASR
ncbi:Enoyl-[acyl-carrier-protein] reductase [NADH] [Actinomyces bovis]|uniref:Enoyl-[acyl-carrier-protein] reductase [NADH] n=1 Tax=Actinomyces bovis TaxID=1658 RepID=A0ABY1VL44_9ACTO|nr:SDR family oxidoreductase [Actinomyces bovis]SPT52477.1 Enoyl-[acyl-carrier-protein] reductase [NADH] [Actinomyces bovis]VEG54167.1 Enoyl-[acyl-carrier-protein] reductase [NADH] [Actinomyces israelii]